MRKNIEKHNTKSRFYAINDVKGITLTTLVITIIVLLILAGVATYTGIEAIDNTKRTRFIAELKIMQSYVNQWYEDCKPNNTETFEGNIASKFTNAGAKNVTNLDSDIKSTAESSLNNANIPSGNNNYSNYYLLEASQKAALGVEGVEQAVLVSVKDRKVVSYLGLKYKNQMYYTIDSIDDENGIDAVYNVGYTAPSTDAPTFTINGFRQENQISAKINLNITYNAKYVNKGTVYYGIIKNNSNRANNYNSTEDTSFIITENGKYDIYVKDAAGNESAHVIKYFSKDANSPKLTDGMIPIKWVERSGENTGNWVVCDKNDIDWFSYDHKLWANIMLSDVTYKADTVQVGQVVAEADLGSMYVWIPRYAYKMPANSQTTKGTIDVTFLNRNTNKTYNGKEFQKETEGVNTSQTPIVHPAFTLGDKELEGIWVAKFEASGTNSSGVAVGNRNNEDGTGTGVLGAVEPEITIVKSLPNKISWRDITIGNMQYYCMAIADSKKAQYGITSSDVNSHLLKNSEWGAVAYLCYSQYGVVPQTNTSGHYVSGKWYYDLYTGQGPGAGVNVKGYTDSDSQKASTTGNVTGIYDMNGGAWEYVAAYYDNGNNYLNTYGQSTSAVAGSVVKYIENKKVKSEYADLWDAYKVSDSVKVYKGTENEETIPTATLASADNLQEKHSLARYLLTKEIFNNLPKGIGVSEISDKFSFYNAYNNGTSNTWTWYKNTGTDENPNLTSEYTTTVWDSDYVLLGNASNPFVVRGGTYHGGTVAGVFSSSIYLGNGYSSFGFRSALVL